MGSKTKKIRLTDKCAVSILQDKTHLVVLWLNREKKILKFSVEHNRHSQSNALATRRIESISCFQRIMLVFSFDS